LGEQGSFAPGHKSCKRVRKERVEREEKDRRPGAADWGVFSDFQISKGKRGEGENNSSEVRREPREG